MIRISFPLQKFRQFPNFPHQSQDEVSWRVEPCPLPGRGEFVDLLRHRGHGGDQLLQWDSGVGLQTVHSRLIRFVDTRDLGVLRVLSSLSLCTPCCLEHWTS